MSSAYRLLSAQHHFRVVDKIPVDGKPILRLSGLSPFRHDVQRTVPLLEKDDVRYNLGTGILFERVIRQTDRSQQLGTLGKIALDRSRRLLPGVNADGTPAHPNRVGSAPYP